MKDTHHRAFLLKTLNLLVGKLLELKLGSNPDQDQNTAGRLRERKKGKSRDGMNFSSLLKHRWRQLKKKTCIFGASQQNFWLLLFCQGFSGILICCDKYNYFEKFFNEGSVRIA